MTSTSESRFSFMFARRITQIYKENREEVILIPSIYTKKQKKVNNYELYVDTRVET